MPSSCRKQSKTFNCLSVFARRLHNKFLTLKQRTAFLLKLFMIANLEKTAAVQLIESAFMMIDQAFVEGYHCSTAPSVPVVKCDQLAQCGKQNQRENTFFPHHNLMQLSSLNFDKNNKTRLSHTTCK
ncbi:conserved hypothetical protein [Trichinella spiralis]|uniref:hypothetical protein n=1 Tax=Trichinella spiralis TaxID=6334 RepID=UPI0001EFDFA7|nr:conserved hypothetical protein [Trichinella spiralis]